MNYLVSWTLRVGIRKDVKDRKPGYTDMYRQRYLFSKTSNNSNSSRANYDEGSQF